MKRDNTLSTTDELFRLLVEEAKDYAMIVLDLNGGIVGWNPGAQRIFGYMEREIIGHQFDLFFVPEDRAAGQPQKELANALEQGRAEDKRWHLRKDGSRFYADGLTMPLRDDGDDVIGFAKISRDVTGRRNAETLLRMQLDVTALIARETDYESGLREIVEIVCRALHCAAGQVWVVAGDRTLRSVVWWDDGAIRDSDFRDFGTNQSLGVDSLPGRAWTERKALSVPDYSETAWPRAALAKSEGFTSALASPIILAGEVYGVMEFFTADRREEDPAVVDALAVVGSQIGQYIERRRADISVRDSEARHRVITETAEEAIFTIDVENRILLANPAAERLFGYSREELIGSSLDIIIPERYRERHRAGLRHYIATGKRRIPWTAVEFPGVRKDGTEIPLELSFGESAVAGQRQFTGIARDISERKRNEAEREELLRRAEDANRTKDEFLATVSHELRTPMSSILGWSRILRSEECAPDTFRLAVEMIENSARMQSQLIEDIIDISRIAAGKFQVELRPIDLVTVVDAAVGALTPAADAKELLINVEHKSDRMLVKGDPHRLQQVVWNLLSNAIKFTAPPGKVYVTLGAKDGIAEVAVCDNGEGIDDEHLSAIFEPFRQVRDNAHGGLGLGLSIVRHLMELHGGGVRAESSGPGEGSTFTIWLPLMQS